MKRQRPVSLLVIGILNIIFGALGVLTGLCGSVGALFMLFLPAPDPQAKPSPLDIFGTVGQMQAELQKVGGPLLTAFTLVQPLLTLIFCALLLIAGIALVGSKPQSWVRWVCVVYAVYSTLFTLTGTAVQIAVINPTVARVQAEQFKQMGPQMQNNPMVGNPIIANASSVLVAALNLAFAFTLLIIMFLPSTAAFYAGSPRAEPDEPDEEPERWRD